jgi:hypothetical protein
MRWKNMNRKGAKAQRKDKQTVYQGIGVRRMGHFSIWHTMAHEIFSLFFRRFSFASLRLCG